jgi:adenylosuccinate lyase
MALAPTLGRNAAQALVRAACGVAAAGGESLGAVLARDDQVIAALGVDGLAAALAPANHLGEAGALVDAAVQRARSCARALHQTDGGVGDERGEAT